MSARPSGNPMRGSTKMTGHTPSPKFLTPAAVPMMIATNDRIDRPTADATMKARMRSPR